MKKFYNYTFDDDLDELAIFGQSLNPNEWDERNKGILKIKNGKATLKILDYFENPQFIKQPGQPILNNENELATSSDGNLYGFLRDGTFVTLESFMKTKSNTSYPGLKSSEYQIFRINLRNSIPDNQPDEFDYFGIEINNLLYWGSANHSFKFPPDNSPIPKISLGHFIKGHSKFELKIHTWQSSASVNGDNHLYEFSDHLRFEVFPEEHFEDKEIADIAEDLNNLLSLLVFSSSYVKSIKKVNMNNGLRSSTINEHPNMNTLSNYVPRLNSLSYSNLAAVFPKILSIYLSRNTELNAVISAVITNITLNSTIESRLITFSSAIDILYRNKKFANNKPVKDLLHKLDLLIQDLPVEIQDLFFDNNEQKNTFCKMIKDTRDFLVHGIRKSSSTILEEIELISKTTTLNWLVVSYVYFQLGIPIENIVDFLSKQQLSISEDDIIK